MKVAVLDACVLYPAGLRDILLWLAAEAVYTPRWSDEIHEEWIRSVLRNRPDLSRGDLERTRQLMDAIDPHALVQGYDGRIESLELPDPADRHVLAAAIHCGATALVTLNLPDFPRDVLKPYGIAPTHPDEFCCSLLDDLPNPFLRAVHKHRESLKRPAKSPEEYVTALRLQGLRRLAARLESESERL
jgi:hypothetical protein